MRIDFAETVSLWQNQIGICNSSACNCALTAQLAANEPE